MEEVETGWGMLTGNQVAGVGGYLVVGWNKDKEEPPKGRVRRMHFKRETKKWQGQLEAKEGDTDCSTKQNKASRSKGTKEKGEKEEVVSGVRGYCCCTLS